MPCERRSGFEAARGMSVLNSTPEWLRDFQHLVRRLQARLPNRSFSNFGEQQIIAKYIARLNIQSRTAVDIGAGDGILSSNTYRLFANGWTGVGIEADEAKFKRLASTYRSLPGVAAEKALISRDNVSGILADSNIEREFGVLSLDIDGNDYWVLDAILSEFRPQLVVSEYNEKIPPPIKFVIDYDPAFEMRHHFYGYSIAKLDDLLEKHSYALLEIEYNNVFLAPQELAGVTGRTAVESYRDGYQTREDRKTKFPDNENMEVLHSLEPKAGVEFLNEFYREHAGKYSIEL